MIDWGFFARHRLGFDLGQLVMSEVEQGLDPADVLEDRRRTCLEGYRAGLAAGGIDVPLDALSRAHAVQLCVSHGVAAVPLERLGDDPSTLEPLVRERARALDHVLSGVGL